MTEHFDIDKQLFFSN